MAEMEYVYGPVPSRRFGISLGISPIPKKTCNYSCIYCQLGRTNHMTNTREMFFQVCDIMKEFETVLSNGTYFDVVTIVGEGEPTLYEGLGKLIVEIKKRTEKPIAVITNGSLLYDKKLREELFCADIVSPTLDAYDEDSFKKINRPHGKLDFHDIMEGLKTFSNEYVGQLWIEIMLIEGMNDDIASLEKYKKILESIRYDKLYINTPVRPPAEIYVKAVSPKGIAIAVQLLGGISIDLLESEGFHSEISDHFEAILSIIKRHPMNQFEIEGFLKSRECKDVKQIMHRMQNERSIDSVSYKGYHTYRLK
ncbi:MAG: radical SAM protein [Clostridia bacterium]|nr:radical SAM protein [Clostridia bacterium]